MITSTYFVGRLQREYNVKVLVAEGEHQTNVHNALYYELVKGVVLGAEMIILACTDFGMIVRPDDCTVPIIDTSLIHCEAAIVLALAD